MDATHICGLQSKFAIALLHNAVPKNSTSIESIVLSPFSLAVALSMAYVGARDETASEFEQLIAKGATRDEINEYFSMLLNKISSPNKEYTLESANKIYVKNYFPILAEYQEALKKYFQGNFENIDFTKSNEASKEINAFVSDTTHGKIQDLVDPSSLGELTRLIIINAIYFKGEWMEKFDPKSTIKSPFYISQNDEKEVDMMHKKGKFIYYDEESVQVLGIPYRGEEVFMLIILPKNRFGLSDFLCDLDAEKLMEWIQKRNKIEVDVQIPKFKLESTHQLIPILKNMGLKRAFELSANFSGISDKDGLLIDEVLQKAFIEVSEEGTEASAATTINFLTRSAMPIREKIEFVADHPFLYCILTNEQNILFIGTYGK